MYVFNRNLCWHWMVLDIAPTLVFLKKTLVKLDRLQQLFAKQGSVRGRGGVARQSQVQAEVGRCRQGPPGRTLKNLTVHQNKTHI